MATAPDDVLWQCFGATICGFRGFRFPPDILSKYVRLLEAFTDSYRRDPKNNIAETLTKIRRWLAEMPFFWISTLETYLELALWRPDWIDWDDLYQKGFEKWVEKNRTRNFSPFDPSGLINLRVCALHTRSTEPEAKGIFVLPVFFCVEKLLQSRKFAGPDGLKVARQTLDILIFETFCHEAQHYIGTMVCNYSSF